VTAHNYSYTVDSEEHSRYLDDPSDLNRLLYRQHVALTRRKRNILFPSGVKLCTQETFDQAVANHLKYFHLRVCQETVWEAFKIFWDRLPERDEYQDWVGRCMDGSVSVTDIGKFFSQSEEHVSLIRKELVDTPEERTGGESEAPEIPTTSLAETTVKIQPKPDAVEETITLNEQATLPAKQEVGEELEKSLGTPSAEEVVVAGEHAKETEPKGEPMQELSLKLRGETYNDSLRDRSSFHYQQLIEDAFERLPGFKNVHVVEFRGLVVLVHYAITVEVDSGGITNDTLDFISLQNNLVEKNYPGTAEQPTIVYTITDFRNYITEALHKDNFLTNSSLEIQPDSPQLENGDHTVAPGGSSTTAPLLPVKHQTGSEVVHALEEGSGSGYSGDGQGGDLWSWKPAANSDGTGFYEKGDNSLEVIPPPDLEETEDEDEEDDIIRIEFTSSLPLRTTTTPALEVSVPKGSTEDPVFDQVLVTPHNSPDPQYSTTTQAPVFSSKDILTVELSEQTVEVSSIYDSKSMTKAYTHAAQATDSPTNAAWTYEAPVFAGTADSAVRFKETIQEVEVTTKPEIEFPVIIVGSKSEVVPEMEEVEVHNVHEAPKVPNADGSSTKEEEEEKEEPTFVVVQTVTIKDYSFGTMTKEPSEIEEFTEKSKVLLPKTNISDEVEILEEHHISTNDPLVMVPIVRHQSEDLVVDEVMVATTTTAAPVQASSTSPDYSSSIVFSPEKDSPFTRVSDTAPEDEEPVFLEPPSHEDGDEVPVINLPSDIPHLTSPVVIINKTEGAPMDSVELSPTTSAQDEVPATTYTNTSKEELGSSILQTTTSSFQEVNNNTPAVKTQPFEEEISDVPSIDVSFDLFQYGNVQTEGDSSGFFSGAQGSDLDAVALPTRPTRALTVFFSLRVTNMAFSMDLFNKSSAEYKALEQRFLELLVPYLQSNLSNFKNLEILNFRNGSIVVNSRMRFGKPVPRGVTSVVYLILEDFANTAYHTMNLAIDKYSLDVESGERADPCKFQACNDFSECMVNHWSGEAECVCDVGYLSVDGLPCQSICDVRADFCLNDGKCDVIPGKGAICRCRVGENWWYRGEHCEEYVSEPLVVGIAILSVAGFLIVAGGIIFFLAKTLRDRTLTINYSPSSRWGDSAATLERATKVNPVLESDPVTGQYYHRYDDELPQYIRHGNHSVPQYSSSIDTDGSRNLSNDEIQHIYENTTLTNQVRKLLMNMIYHLFQ
uniref:SEA domain-containing protein n=1 Tax=Mola mola TaxID=94237 RepID=A0A3Q3WQY1_MOLML